MYFSGKFIIEPSYVFCEELIEGRLSFQGENPEIEKIMEQEWKEKHQDVEPKNETDVTDVEMAQTLRATKKINVSNFAVKYDPKEEPKRKKPKFLKPVD